MRRDRTPNRRLVALLLLVSWTPTACITWEPVSVQTIPAEARKIRVTTSDTGQTMESDAVTVIGDTLVVWEELPRGRRSEERAVVLRVTEENIASLEAARWNGRASALVLGTIMVSVFVIVATCFPGGCPDSVVVIP